MERKLLLCVSSCTSICYSSISRRLPFLPVSKAKDRKIHKYLENRRIFASDTALAADTLLVQTH
jgi:hypothetical protein